MPSSGSSEKPIATLDAGLTKNARIAVMSLSPITVTDIAGLALGASIMMRIQMSSPLPADRRVAVVIGSSLPLTPLIAIVLISVAAAAALRAGRAARAGIGADVATMLEWSTGEVEGGA